MLQNGLPDDHVRKQGRNSLLVSFFFSFHLSAKRKSQITRPLIFLQVSNDTHKIKKLKKGEKGIKESFSEDRVSSHNYVIEEIRLRRRRGGGISLTSFFGPFVRLAKPKLSHATTSVSSHIRT